MDDENAIREVQIEKLANDWKRAKQTEKEAQEARIAIESRIYELTEKMLPDKGTMTFECGLKVTTGFTEEWDQDALGEAYKNWPVDTVRFPFAGVWKPDGKAITVIRESIPYLYDMLRPALTIKPKKPAFAVKE